MKNGLVPAAYRNSDVSSRPLTGRRLESPEPFGFGPLGKPSGCPICGRPLTFHQRVAGQICGHWRCRTAQLEGEMAAFRDQAAATLGVARPDAYPMVVVPDDPADSAPQPRSRQQAHVDFLYDLCVQALTGDSGAEERFPATEARIEAPDPIASCVCAVCQGACCHLGKEHAFLDRETIRRFVVHSDLVDPLQIVYAYASRMPSTAVIDGCVYQADQGCALPRRLRADMCNAYRCKGLKQAEQMIRQQKLDRICVIVRENHRISRAAFVQPHRIRHYPEVDRLPAD